MLYLSRFRKPLERIGLSLIFIYFFTDVAIKFKMFAQSSKLEKSGLSVPIDRSKQLDHADVFKDNSIFELFVYSREYRSIISTFIAESLVKLLIQLFVIAAFFRLVVYVLRQALQ